MNDLVIFPLTRKVQSHSGFFLGLDGIDSTSFADMCY
jgi:hypothetical protein